MQPQNTFNRGNLTENQGKVRINVTPETSIVINTDKIVRGEENNGTTYVCIDKENAYVGREIATDKTEDTLLMSVKELKTYEGFENMNEAEAEEYIYTMQQFCTLTFELFKQEKP